jgi:hypothetical protein
MYLEPANNEAHSAALPAPGRRRPEHRRAWHEGCSRPQQPAIHRCGLQRLAVVLLLTSLGSLRFFFSLPWLAALGLNSFDSFNLAQLPYLPHLSFVHLA